MTTTDPESPTQIMRDLVEAANGPGDLAHRTLDQLNAEQRAEWLTELAVEKATALLRHHTRSVEERVDREIAEGTPPTVARKLLRTEGFALPTGEWVSWLDATVEQHLMRAEYLRTKADGIVHTAERHERAATEIENAGVTCLADIEDAA